MRGQSSVFSAGSPTYLFDMLDDIEESQDLSASEPQTIEALEQTFRQWKRDLPEPDHKSDGIADTEGPASRTQRKALNDLRDIRR